MLYVVPVFPPRHVHVPYTPQSMADLYRIDDLQVLIFLIYACAIASLRTRQEHCASYCTYPPPLYKLRPVFAEMGPGFCTPRPIAKITVGNAHGKAGGQAVPAGWEGGRPRTRFPPLYVRRLYAEYSAKGVWAGGIGRGEGGAQSIAEGFPTALFNLHPGFVAVGGIKGSMEPSVQGEIPAPASDAGRLYCRVDRGSAALARRIQHVCASA